MEILGKSTKGLKKTEGDWDKAAPLVEKALDAAKKSRDLIPSSVAKLPDGAEKTAAIEDYKKRMDTLIAGFTDLQAAVAAKDPAKFATLLKDLNQMKKEGHNAFIEEEEE